MSDRLAPTTPPDTKFFWDALKNGKLLIQRCAGCATLRHPPRPMCPRCNSLAWNTIESSGRGTVYSFVLPGHPPWPWFDGTYIVVVVELEEGTRIVSNLCDVDPVLRLLDCCQESDGGVALVVAAAQGAADDGELMTSYYRPEITGLPEMGVVASKLWSASGLTPNDIQAAFLYDHFTPFVLVQLEELGFCGRGEAKHFATIENLSLGGRLPVNTSGGLLGEAYVHGMNGITEAVRQIRGTSRNQVPGEEHVLVTAGTGCPTSGLILGRA